MSSLVETGQSSSLSGDSIPEAANVTHSGEVVFAPKDLSVLMGFSKGLFFGRMDQVIQDTAGYGGQLKATWQQSLAGSSITAGSGGSYEVQLPQLGKCEREQIDTAVRRIRNSQAASVVIEAAHVYCYDTLDDPDLCESIVLQSQFAASLSESLEEAGIATKQILFIDDYNPNPNSNNESDQQRLDVHQFIDLTRNAGYQPEMILREGDMVPLAKQIIRAMDLQSLVAHDTTEVTDESIKNEALYLSRGHVELYRAEDDMVSCAMLDAALTLLKLQYLGESVVNVLPRRPENNEFSYKNQQRKMRNIVGEHLNARVLPVANLFVGQGDQVPLAAGAHNVLRKRSRD